MRNERAANAGSPAFNLHDATEGGRNAQLLQKARIAGHSARVTAAASLQSRARPSKVMAISSFQHSLAIRSQICACPARHSAIRLCCAFRLFPFRILMVWHTLWMQRIWVCYLGDTTGVKAGQPKPGHIKIPKRTYCERRTNRVHCLSSVDSGGAAGPRCRGVESRP